jgi:uncharacterized protein
MAETKATTRLSAIVSDGPPGRYNSGMTDLERLAAHLEPMGRVLLGFSGGVDSSLLAVAGVRALGVERFLAVLGVSPSLADAGRAQAGALAEQFGVPFAEVETRELEDPRYAANPTNRCFFCKAELWSRLTGEALARGFDSVIDGTNADDLTEHRPGLGAALQYQVRSPLAELGWRKADIRTAARALGIPVWDAPASPCLSSRIRYGVAVTPQRLRQVEQAETFLRSLGVEGDLRVRHLGESARIEVLPSQFALLDRCWAGITRVFHDLGFTTVERDPTGYRRGALLSLAGAR